jgi:hypothetical protein
MPLTPGELDRVRAELGYNVLNVGAEPFIGVHAVFSQVIAPYLREGNDTTSATAVTASDTGTFVTLTVASATGITLHERVAVDVDDYLEMATVRSVSGTSVGVILKKMHAGTYPVTVDGGLVQIRECLAALYNTHQKINDLEGTGGLKAVDEIQFYDAKGKTHLQVLNDQLEHWRDELRSRLGIPRQPIAQSYGGSCVLY